MRGEASGPRLEGWSRGPRGLHPRSHCSQCPRRARSRVRAERPWGAAGPVPRATEDEVIGWHHRLNGHEFE